MILKKRILRKDERGLSAAIEEMIILALALLIITSAGALWLNTAKPQDIVKLEIIGSNRKIAIYDIAGILDCRNTRILLQDENFTIIEEFKYNQTASKFIGEIKGWTSNTTPAFLNPGDCIILNVDTGEYLVTISNPAGVIAQCTIIVR